MPVPCWITEPESAHKRHTRDVEIQIEYELVMRLFSFFRRRKNKTESKVNEQQHQKRAGTESTF